MKAFTSIIRIGRRRRVAAGSPWKRPERTFASTFAALEGRALLSAVGPVPMSISPSTQALTATTEALIASIPGPLLPPPRTIWAGANSSPSHVDRPGQSGPDGTKGVGQATQAGQPPQYTPVGEPGDHVAMDVAKVVVDGQRISEFALADFAASEVFVRLGFDGSTLKLGPAQGINHPDSVTLADLNDDGIPDLIVANTNGDNVLIFPGLGEGQFGPSEDGARGLAVGSDPIGVAVNYVGGDPAKAQLIVANAESDSVSIFDGQASGGAWTTTALATIATPTLPVKTLLYDVDDDGNPDLLVCGSGSDSVTLYKGLGDGSFATTASATFIVGSNPAAMFVGSFERRGQVDLVTVNAGSDDLTFIGDAFGPRSVTQTIPSGGSAPDAAFAFDPGHTGVMDLVVANGGDGRVAVFRGGGDGLQLAGVITQASVPTPTALAPSYSVGDGFDFFAAGAGNDAALLLHFDLGIASTYLPASSGESAAVGGAEGELVAELMPFGDSSLSLIAALWAVGGDPGASPDAWTFRDPSSLTSLYSPTEGQGVEETRPLPETSKGPTPPPAKPADPSKVDDTRWARWVSGVDQALDRPLGFLEAVAARDLEDDVVRPVARLALEPPPSPIRPITPDVEAASAAVDEALRLFWSEGATRGELAPGESPARPAPELDGIDAALEVRLETVPLISSALVVSTGLILKILPPRPSVFRRKPGLRGFVSLEHDRRAVNRPGPI